MFTKWIFWWLHITTRINGSMDYLLILTVYIAEKDYHPYIPLKASSLHLADSIILSTALHRSLAWSTRKFLLLLKFHSQSVHRSEGCWRNNEFPMKVEKYSEAKETNLRKVNTIKKEKSYFLQPFHKVLERVICFHLSSVNILIVIIKVAFLLQEINICQ